MPSTNVLVIGNPTPLLTNDIFISLLKPTAIFFAKDSKEIFSILSKRVIRIIFLKPKEIEKEIFSKLKKVNIPLVFLDTISIIEQLQEEQEVLFDGFFATSLFNQSLKNFLTDLANTPEISQLNREKEASTVAESFFFIKHEHIYKRIEIKDLFWVEVDKTYSILNFEDKKYALKISLTKLHQNLPDKIFLRIHKRFVINSEHIKGIDPTKNEIYIKDKMLPIGRTYKVAVLERFKLLF